MPVVCVYVYVCVCVWGGWGGGGIILRGVACMTICCLDTITQ